MKKLLFSVVAACLLITSITSCNKSNLNSVDQTTTSVQSDKYRYYQNEIEKARLVGKTGKQGIVPLADFGTVLSYAKADGGGAITTFRWTVGVVGPGYAAAFGMLGGLFASTAKYYKNHYIDHISSPTTGDPFTSGYTDDYSKVGYHHNVMLLGVLLSDPTRPSSLSVIDATHYNDFCDSAAAFFEVDASELKDTDVRNSINSYVSRTDTVNTVSQYETVFNELNLDADVIDIYTDFLTDIEAGSATSSSVYNYVSLYSGLVENDSNLSTSEKDQLLQAFQVYKYSFSFWSTNLQ